MTLDERMDFASKQSINLNIGTLRMSEEQAKQAAVRAVKMIRHQKTSIIAEVTAELDVEIGLIVDMYDLGEV